MKDPLVQKLQSVLIPLESPDGEHDQPKSAAVLVPLIWRENWQVLLTRRARHLKHHAGQISFPGGRFEPEDMTLANTALRESYEETGIQPEQVELIGKLPQQDTISRYNVTPFVGVVHPPLHLKMDTSEVCDIFEVPLEHILQKQNQQQIVDQVNGQSYRFHLIRYNAYNIWGATARILVNLSRRLTLSDEAFQ